MTTRVDLVMPKLGLTMTEGKVARWAVAPGASFATGDVVVVVETDKIAFDIEAPGAGTLSDILVPEGETAAVGTPIAQWRPVEGAKTTAADTASAPVSPAPPPPVPAAVPPRPPAARTGGRIVATPYARRLARDAALDLATVTPANTRRITAADVEAALAHRTASAAPAPHSGGATATGFSFYGAEIGVDRLLRLIDEIDDSSPDLRPSLCHFIALAAARALAASDVSIALMHNGLAPRQLPREATRRLSSIIAADRGDAAGAGGPITLMISDANGVTLLGRAPIEAAAALGVGAVRQVFSPDPEGRPVLRAEVSLVLSVGDGALPDAPGVLARIGALLENPLVLLAS